MKEEIISGIIAGIIYSLSGWQTNQESFDFKKLIKSVFISGIVGLIAGFTGQDFNVLMVGSAGIGVTALVNKLIYFIKIKFGI